MSKSKSILVIILSLFLLCGIIFGIFFLLRNTSNTNETEFTLAEAEEIQVQIENKGIDDFNNIGFIGEKINDSKSKFKNIVTANDNELRMKNITWNDILGEMILYAKDGKITSFCFNSNEYASASDIAIIFELLNTKFCENNNVTKSEILITNGKETKKFENPEDLYDTNKYLCVKYKIGEKNIVLRTNRQNDKIFITASPS